MDLHTKDVTTHISEVERDLEVSRERLCEFRIEFKNFKEIVAHYFMKITVGQGTNVTGGFPYRCVDAGVLTENVVFA